MLFSVYESIVTHFLGVNKHEIPTDFILSLTHRASSMSEERVGTFLICSQRRVWAKATNIWPKSAISVFSVCIRFNCNAIFNSNAITSNRSSRGQCRRLYNMYVCFFLNKPVCVTHKLKPIQYTVTVVSNHMPVPVTWINKCHQLCINTAIYQMLEGKIVYIRCFCFYFSLALSRIFAIIRSWGQFAMRINWKWNFMWMWVECFSSGNILTVRLEGSAKCAKVF